MFLEADKPWLIGLIAMETFGYLVGMYIPHQVTVEVIHIIHICKLIHFFPGYLNDFWKFEGEEWVWVSGTNLVNQYGKYGEKHVPQSINFPGGRAYAVSWMDNSGNMWMFGGTGFAEDGTSGSVIL
jgi:hypothetical protein